MDIWWFGVGRVCLQSLGKTITKQINKMQKTREYADKIPQEKFSKWRELWRMGDNKKIQEQTGLSEQTVVNAIRHGFGTQNTIDLINGFYKSKEKELKKLERLEKKQAI
jgi:hypothetical protein